MYHIGVLARLREGQKSNEDPFVIKSALGASAGALGKIFINPNWQEAGSISILLFLKFPTNKCSLLS